MVKGTPSMGKKAKGGTHIRCRRCGQHSFHEKKGECSHCGFGKSPKLRNYKFTDKAVNKKRRQ
ncbi:MAG: 50S ribosomal protein L37e [Nanoarchaeota archaeon]|nr:50S ribosomal protein L37e [Nanoarchaeota archaeon]